jgi:beta-mannanase
VQHYGVVERAIGRRFDIVLSYMGWQPGVVFPDPEQARLAKDGRRILDFSWDAINFATRATASYQSIADGKWDRSVLRHEARRLKAFHQKVFIEFNHEFDDPAQSGRGTPAQYAAAYRHIHRYMRLAGVTNIIWVWVSTGYLGDARQIAEGYPGSGYVNWIGYDPYNFASCRSEAWRTPFETFQPFYHWLQMHPHMRDKPILLNEYASATGPAVGRWYAGVARTLQRLPKIKAVMQWSSAMPTCDFRLTDSAAALAGFAKSSNAPYITGAK